MSNFLKRGIYLVLLFISHHGLFGQKVDFSTIPKKKVDEQVWVYQLVTDTLFNSKQQIFILRLPKSSLDQYKIDVAYADTLAFTSQIAQKENAIAAINGSFFDMDQGGSVTYHENEGAVVYPTREEGKKWAFDPSLLSGAIILDHSNNLHIREAKPDEYFQESENESVVLVSGPLLLLENQKMKLPDLPFVKDQHPRTCLCDTREAILLVTIDGRSGRAAGMNLMELQDFMSQLGCQNAINLDGGGSVTMWATKELINTPSDERGERPVANAIIITKENRE